MALQDYLSVMALGLNDQQHGETAKLSSADPHMLAAYCFDLTRKQHYLYMALRLSEDERRRFKYNGKVIASADTLAEAIYDDTQFVESAAGQRRQELGSEWNSAADWEARAYALQEVIIRQWRAIQADHRELFAVHGQPTPTYTPAPSHGERSSQ